MSGIFNITKPVFLVDTNTCRRNIQGMLKKSREHGLSFRPHFKTHQSAGIGEFFRETGIDKITVSSVQMAEYFARTGWKDITIAFPLNLPEIERIETLTRTIELNVLISSADSARKLMQLTKTGLSYFIEIDCGYHRSGILAEDIEQIEAVISELNQHNFLGFLTHSGNTYQATSIAQIIQIHREAQIKLTRLKELFASVYPDLIISIGDTPSCTVAEDFSGIDEIRPGNFSFYDLMQYELGVCDLADIAVCVACPIVDLNPDRNEIVIYGGAIHLSKEFLLQKNGEKSFGAVTKITGNSWSEPIQDAYIAKLSQEHGIINMKNNIEQFEIGEIIGIIPVHSCLTADLYEQYLSLDGEIITKM